MSIEPQEATARKRLGLASGAYLAWASLIALPAVMAIAGVRAWRSRRRAATLTPSRG